MSELFDYGGIIKEKDERHDEERKKGGDQFTH